MLIDMLTARISWEHLPKKEWENLQLLNDRVVRFCPRTGDVRWESSSWDSIRSDSHQIAYRVGSDALWIHGSPARVTGDGCTVFGSGASSALDLVGCLRIMAAFVSQQIGFSLPADPSLWIVSRIDVTQNIKLKSLSDVRVALRHLRECEGGRYRVSQQAGDTVYWGGKSRLRKGKAYAKGPHIEYMTKRPDYSGRPYTSSEILQASQLLRLELTLGSQYLRERLHKQWYELTPSDITAEWNDYFNRMIGNVTMSQDTDVKQRILDVSQTEGQGKAAHLFWLFIQSEGWQRAKEEYPKPTFYRHLKILHQAGLGDMDISTGRVVPFRQRIIEAQHVNSWSDLRKAA